jgi:hypothetical protein
VIGERLPDAIGFGKVATLRAALRSAISRSSSSTGIGGCASSGASQD